MEAAKIFESEEGQAVLLPEGFRFEDSEVLVKRQGETIVLMPKEVAWQTLSHAISGFSDDFMADGRPPEIPDVREELDSSGQLTAYSIRVWQVEGATRENRLACAGRLREKRSALSSLLALP